MRMVLRAPTTLVGTHVFATGDSKLTLTNKDNLVPTQQMKVQLENSLIVSILMNAQSEVCAQKTLSVRIAREVTFATALTVLGETSVLT